MPNAFPIWHILHSLPPLLKINHRFRIPTQKSLVPSKSLKNHMEQVFEHKGKVMSQTRTVPRQPPEGLHSLEQTRTVPEQSSYNPRTIFPRLLKHNDNFPLSIRANAGNPHSAPRHRQPPDNNNDRHNDNNNGKYDNRYHFKCFKPY